MQAHGFSLLELLIAVAITGILAAMAIPSWQTYTIKARVAEGFQLVETAKLAVAETALLTNRLPSDSTEAGYTGLVPTKNVESITIGEKGIITLRFSALAGDGTLLLVPALYPTGEIDWHCTGGSLNINYRPAVCRLEKTVS